MLKETITYRFGSKSMLRNIYSIIDIFKSTLIVISDTHHTPINLYLVYD